MPGLPLLPLAASPSDIDQGNRLLSDTWDTDGWSAPDGDDAWASPSSSGSKKGGYSGKKGGYSGKKGGYSSSSWDGPGWGGHGGWGGGWGWSSSSSSGSKKGGYSGKKGGYSGKKGGYSSPSTSHDGWWGDGWSH